MQQITPPPAAPTSAPPAQKPFFDLASPSVVVLGVNEKLLNFVDYLAFVHRVVFSKPLVITSGKDAIHVAGSLHAEGLAVDIRTRDLEETEQLTLLGILAYAGPANHIAIFDERALGGEAHIHLEYHG